MTCYARQGVGGSKDDERGNIWRGSLAGLGFVFMLVLVLVLVLMFGGRAGCSVTGAHSVDRVAVGLNRRATCQSLGEVSVQPCTPRSICQQGSVICQQDRLKISPPPSTQIS